MQIEPGVTHVMSVMPTFSIELNSIQFVKYLTLDILRPERDLREREKSTLVAQQLVSLRQW